MNGDSWVKETLKLIEDWENQEQHLQNKIEQLQEEAMDLRDSIVAGHALIQAYMAKHHIGQELLGNISINHLVDMSYPNMLVEIAKMREGYLKVADAVELLLKANISHDKRAIQANVYSALHRQKQKFTKIAPGEYRLLNGIRKSDGKPSGLRQAVKQLKEKNPQMTKNEVLNYLIKSGFDFKGKKPTNAVNITWAYLGYSKEGKQQSLLEHTE